MRISTSPLMADGFLTLWKGRECVYAGGIGDQIRGIDFDEIMLSPRDSERLAAHIDKLGGKLRDVPASDLR